MKLTSAPVVFTSAAASLLVAIPTDSRTLGAGGVGVSVTTVGASTSYQVQITLDDIYAPGYTPATGNWFTPAAGQFTGVISGTTVAAGTYIGQITTYCTAIRLQVTALTTSASILAWQQDSTQGA
jgi:hypothetical protein